MKIFYITLIPLIVFSLIASLVRKNDKKPGLFFSLVVIIILVLVAGMRNGIGDTWAYAYTFSNLTPNSAIFSGGYEPGFILLLKLIKLISPNPQIMIFITAAITNILNIWIIRKYSKNSYFELGVFLYIVSGYYIVTMNGIRQSLVAAIIFAATPLIVKGKFKLYFVIICLLATIHSSAFIMIPIYFIARKEPWSKGIVKLFILVLIGIILYDPMIAIIFKVLGNTKYGDYINFKEGGANILRIAVTGVPVILSYMKKDKISLFSKEERIFVNISLINLTIMCFSYFNWIFARFTIYTQLYSFVLLPYIIRNYFHNRKEKRLLYFCLVIFYICFFIYDSKVSKINWTTDFILKDFFYYQIN